MLISFIPYFPFHSFLQIALLKPTMPKLALVCRSKRVKQVTRSGFMAFLMFFYFSQLSKSDIISCCVFVSMFKVLHSSTTPFKSTDISYVLYSLDPL